MNVTKLLPGKPLHDQLCQQMQAVMPSLPRQPLLAVVQVGNNPVSALYINFKRKAAEQVGIGFRHVKLTEDISATNLSDEIQRLNKDNAVTGIILQLPLPKHLHAQATTIINLIDPAKDVDGLTATNIGKLNQLEAWLKPATPFGIMRLLEHYDINLKGTEVVVVGTSNLVGAPVARLASLAGATVTSCNRTTIDLAKHTKQAELLIVAAGHPDLITAKMISPGVTIIDVGISRVEDTSHARGYRTVGDVNAVSVEGIAAALTPVPGGVGPMTVATLLTNCVDAVQPQVWKL